jgi:putative addiction module component (TIGR02574 family)
MKLPRDVSGIEFNQIEQEALNLPEKERALLAERLLCSLGDEAADLNKERWMQEADRRYDEYKAGRMTARPAGDVFRDIYRTLE